MMQRPVIALLAVASLCGCRPVVSELEDVRLSVFQRIAPPAEPMGEPTSGGGRPGPFLSVTVLSHSLGPEDTLVDRPGIDCPDLGGVTVRVDGDRLSYGHEPSTVLVGASSGGLYRCGGSFLGLGAPEVLDQGRIVLSDAAGDHVFDVPSLREPVGLTLLDTQPEADGAGTRIRFGLSPWAAAVAPEVTQVTVFTYSQDYDGWLEREELRDAAGLVFGTDGFTAVTRERGEVKLVVTLETNELACEGGALPCSAARYVHRAFDVDVP